MIEYEKKKTGYFCIRILFVVHCCMSDLSEYKYNLVGVCSGWTFYVGTIAKITWFGEGNEEFEEQLDFGANAVDYSRGDRSQSCIDYGIL